MPIEIKDITGLSQPLTKLIEVVSGAIGTTFRPAQIRREADARAYEKVILAKADAEAQTAAREVSLNASNRSIDQLAVDQPEIAERARQRLITKEIEGQLNIESIAQLAANNLPEAVPDQPINHDWRRKFFSEAENICETDMQLIWGKVLAGELSQPGKFSLRTLDTLRQLSSNEAGKFAQICSLAMSTGWVALPGHDVNTALTPFGIFFNDILDLRDAGLLMAGDNLSKNFSASNPEAQSDAENNALLKNNGIHIWLSWPKYARPEVRSLIFTKAGKELQSLMQDTPNESYLKAIAPPLRSYGFTKVKRGIETQIKPNSSVLNFDEDL